MVIPFYIVDAFVTENKQFTGNPAGVCVLSSDDEIDDETKQKIASEINLSETAFVGCTDTGASSLRWFTPTTEVPLCGHATLATAKVLFDRMASLLSSSLAETKLVFQSKCKGTLTATMDWKTGLIALDFPSVPSEPVDRSLHPWVDQVTEHTLAAKDWKNMVKNVEFASGLSMLVIELDEELPEQTFVQIKPDFNKLMTIETGNLRGVILTVKSKEERLHFRSRYFGPWEGVPEDPVTGSAHSVLTPYWCKRYNINVVQGRQESTRTGEITCELSGNRVHLKGNAKIVVKGELMC